MTPTATPTRQEAKMGDRTMRTSPLAGIVLITLLTACSGQEGASDPAATMSVAPAPAVTSAVPSASARDWADAMAPAGDDLADALDDWDDATCSSGALAGEDVTCSAIFVALGYTLESAQLVVNGAAKLDGPTYLGVPPSDIADLYQETAGMAATAVEAHARASESCDQGADACQGDAFTAMRHAASLDDLFDEWDRVQ